MLPPSLLSPSHESHCNLAAFVGSCKRDAGPYLRNFQVAVLPSKAKISPCAPSP